VDLENQELDVFDFDSYWSHNRICFSSDLGSPLNDSANALSELENLKWIYGASWLFYFFF
jgi:hypothetical protein